MKPLLRIDRNIIADNFRALGGVFKGEISACVKANAFGIGVENAFYALNEVGCEKFFVATVEEGIELRKISRKLCEREIRIYILEGVSDKEKFLFQEYDLIPVINTLDQMTIWREFFPETSCPIHIDTGMNRLGMNLSDFSEITMGDLKIDFIMSHLACADDKDHPSNLLQLQKFNEATKKYSGIKRSLVASDGIFLGEEYHFDIARVGAALYGLGARKRVIIKNPVSLQVPVIQIRKTDEDGYVGYGATFFARKGSVLAVLPIGYADGFFRGFSSKAFLYYNDKAFPVVGRISMDLTVVDITGCDIKTGDYLEIIGSNQYPDDLAKNIGAIGYEILTSLRSLRCDMV